MYCPTRVLDLTSDIFNDSFNPYWHKSIGGYSPAKLQRYQDLIDRYLVNEIQSIYSSLSNAKTIAQMEEALPKLKLLSALNAKYLIVSADFPPVINHQAYGNAWFVDDFADAPTPDDEIGLLETTDLRSTAIVGADFKEALSGFKKPEVNNPDANNPDVNEPDVILSEAKDLSSDFIQMTYYSPNELHFHYSAASTRPAIFSEVYYPKGWHATLDPGDTPGSGSDLDLFRADWILRGAILPAGEHDIVMRFDPEVHSISNNVSRASSAILLVLVVAAAVGMYLARKKETNSLTN